jgi:hypothetical protein
MTVSIPRRHVTIRLRADCIRVLVKFYHRICYETLQTIVPSKTCNSRYPSFTSRFTEFALVICFSLNLNSEAGVLTPYLHPLPTITTEFVQRQLHRAS